MKFSSAYWGLMMFSSSFKNQRFLLIFSILLSLFLNAGSPANALSIDAVEGKEIILGAAPFQGYSYAPPLVWIVEKMETLSTYLGSPLCTTISINNTDFPPEVHSAFQAVVNLSETVVSSPADITIEANWTSLDEGVLGNSHVNIEGWFSFPFPP